jgi:gamma-aminobutyric acid receptor subunit beta
MSWTVFWIDPAQFGPQIGMSATSMLTLIAFQFAMANILPRLSYYTLLDKFIVGSTIIVFLSLIASVTTSYLVAMQKRETALRIDCLCRLAFPAAFAAFNLIIFSVFNIRIWTN